MRKKAFWKRGLAILLIAALMVPVMPEPGEDGNAAETVVAADKRGSALADWNVGEQATDPEDMPVINGVKHIMLYGLKGTRQETEISVPDHFTVNGQTYPVILAGLDDTTITSITISEGVKIYGTGLFSGCSSLTDVNAPSVEIIDQASNDASMSSMFSRCTSLTSLDLSG